VTAILGVSAYYHDSAAALVRDGVIVAAAQEERFSRKKYDAGFPSRAISYCLSEAGIALADVDAVVFYDKPLLKFERLLQPSLERAPRGFRSFLMSMPVWLKEKLHLKSLLKKQLAHLAGGAGRSPRLLFSEHHQAHAASAFFASPFRSAAVLCLDGVGEWATTSLWLGEGERLTPRWQLDFPDSLGLLYSAFTYHTGFKVNSGEYKLMGLAPYGTPRFADLIYEHLLDLKADGTFRLDQRYFDYETGLRMTSDRFDDLFEGAPRSPDAPLTQREMDMAASIQLVTEEVMLRLCRTARAETGAEYLCLAGGVALNCVANGRLLRESEFKDIWVQPAAGDAGGAIGAALSAWHQYFGAPRSDDGDLAPRDLMRGSFLGPRFSTDEVRGTLDALGAAYTCCDDDALFARVAALLDEGSVIGWFSGRMEFGPRALGNRSILGDPRNAAMQSRMNQKIKFRESFRPFAPAILVERLSEYFDIDTPTPYMMFTAPVREEWRCAVAAGDEHRFGLDRLGVVRSAIPAVTHVDFSARVQSVDAVENPRFHALLRAFERKTGCPVLVNTSFNVRGEPIVCTPADAYDCFIHTGMDYLVIENFIMERSQQAAGADPAKRRFEAD
jgi:carbamoyltransferase